MKLFLIAVLFLAAVPGWTAEIYTFSLLPESGTIAGAPGQEVGWGSSIENQSTTHWLVTSGLAPSSFQFGTPELLFDFPILAPGSSVSAPFDAAASTGLLALTWDPSAPLGSVETGSFLLNAEWWNGDPLAGGQFAFAASPLSQSYQATVVPEPGTAALFGLALLMGGGTAGVRRRWRQRS
ncbi:MAG TPA: PEP-CTERM sorting domain-containing protein [Bryobacteraceae bacterium]|nr:PEP-CTERM sorting domain-containing protein [Bryobacteraceae bacterium]